MSIFDDFKERANHPTPAELDHMLVGITVRLPEATIKKAAFLANKLGCTRQSILREILDDALNEAFNGYLVGSGVTPDEYEKLTLEVSGYAVSADNADFDINEEQEELDI